MINACQVVFLQRSVVKAQITILGEECLLDVFLPFFCYCSYFLNTGCLEAIAIAKVLFQTCDLLFVLDQPGAFPSTCSQPTSTLDNTRENLAWPSLQSFISALSIFSAKPECFTVLPLGARPTPWGEAGSPSTRGKGGYQTCGGAALTW